MPWTQLVLAMLCISVFLLVRVFQVSMDQDFRTVGRGGASRRHGAPSAPHTPHPTTPPNSTLATLVLQTDSRKNGCEVASRFLAIRLRGFWRSGYEGQTKFPKVAQGALKGDPPSGCDGFAHFGNSCRILRGFRRFGRPGVQRRGVGGR